MRARLTAFRNSRRSAVAMIFALSFIPLIYLVGLSVDYTFFSLARSQMQLAAEAAATHAVRAAVSTYTLEKSQGISQTNAYNDAQEAGTQAGYQWFNAQLGTLPRGTVQYNGSSNPYPNVTITNPNDPGGFYVKVQYSGVYPPLFNGLFGRSSQWTYPGDSEAEATFSYAQVLFMLDTSNSMLIGANTTDIDTMSYHSICLLGGTSTYNSSTGIWTPSTPGVVLSTANNNIGTVGDGALNSGSGNNLAYYTGTSPNADTSDVLSLTNGEFTYSNNAVTGLGSYFSNTAVMNYQPPSGGPTSTHPGSCDSGPPTATPNAVPPGTTPLSPCALACHTTTTEVTDSASTASNPTADNPPYGTYTNGLSYGDSFSMDLYGEVRRIRKQEINSGLYQASLTSANPALALRLDVVFNAVETSLTTMNTDEDIPNQFSAGVYQFNQDVSAIAEAATSAQITAGAPTDTLEEATETLANVITAVDNDDYIITGVEGAIPGIVTSTAASTAGGFTDFQQSMDDLYYGYTSTGPVTSNVSSNHTSLYSTATSLYAEECSQNAAEAVTLGVSATFDSAASHPGSAKCNLPSVAGETQGNPQRFLFVVTDGLDDYYNSSGTRLGGEMTSATTEASGADSDNATSNEDGYPEISANSYPICQQFKNLGYTIYVLYITYYPVPSFWGYYNIGNFTATAWTGDDFSTLKGDGVSTQEVSEEYYTAANTPLSTTPVDQVGLKACASANADFYTATGTGDIENAMTQMLASALSSTVRLSK